MAINTGSVLGETVARTLAAGSFAGAVYEGPIGMSNLTEAANAAGIQAAREACVVDPTVEGAVRATLEGSVGGSVGGNVCNLIDGSGNPISNVAQNVAESAATAHSGSYADSLVQGVNTAFLHGEWHTMGKTVVLALLGATALWVGGRIRENRTGNRHLYLRDLFR